MCTKFQFDSASQNSSFVDHADGSSQFCLLARGVGVGGWGGGGGECSREFCPSKCNNKIDLQLLNIDKFSNYKLLLNYITALVLTFINNLQKSLS